jgi:hypothetical protein
MSKSIRLLDIGFKTQTVGLRDIEKKTIGCLALLTSKGKFHGSFDIWIYFIYQLCQGARLKNLKSLAFKFKYAKTNL